MSNNAETMDKSAFKKGLQKAWEEYLKEEHEKKYPNIMLSGISGAACCEEKEEVRTSNEQNRKCRTDSAVSCYRWGQNASSE